MQPRKNDCWIDTGTGTTWQHDGTQWVKQPVGFFDQSRVTLSKLQALETALGQLGFAVQYAEDYTVAVLDKIRP
jgi:hypothetical protein